MRYKRKAIVVLMSSALMSANASYVIPVEGEYTPSSDLEIISKNISEWKEEGSFYNCTTWSPLASTKDIGLKFDQFRTCSQKETRTMDIYKIDNFGVEIFQKEKTERRTVSVIDEQESTGTRNDIDSTRIANWSIWNNENGLYDCDSWSPQTSEISHGTTFEQTRNCSQNQERTRNIYNVWTDGSETLKEIESEDRVEPSVDKRNSVGTNNFILTTRSENWSNWSDKGNHYSCSFWTPDASSIDIGESFEQTRDCAQDQIRTQNIYNVWADNSETLKETKEEEKTIIEEDSQNVTGTRNDVDSLRNGTWSSWSDSGSNYNCNSWTPLASTIDHGVSFEQTRNCSRNQERTRNVYNVWTDGSETLKETETDNQVIPKTESQNVTGTRNDVDSLRNGTWSNWSNKGQTFNCDSWTPLASTIDHGISFEQTRNCSQNQERTRNIYNVWTDGSETLKEIETGNQVVPAEEKQNSVGTKNFKDTTRADSWSSWVDSGSHYNCDSWTPLASTIDHGVSFEQTRNCSQNQERTRNIYDVWADGSETLKEIETGNQVVPAEEKQNSVGTRNFKDTTRADSWSNWVDSGSHYDCDVWTPLRSSIDIGQSFEQTRDCSQNQERTRNIYDVWADGSETLKETETGNQVVTEEESQNATGTRNDVDSLRNGSWSSWSNKGQTFNCNSWTPLTSTVDYGDTFEQTRDCSQNQERTRNIYNVWTDGSETLKETETGNQVVPAEEKQNSVGTRNFKDTTRAGSWSSWVDSGSHYSCNSWTPLTSTVDYGDTFEQTRDCSQDQTRERNIYDVWADGSETFKEVETGIQVVTEEESQNSVGTRNFKDTTRAVSWSSWVDSGVHYDCDSWTPLASTVDYGDTFEQTRDCSQAQTRERDIYDVWADGSETLRETETGMQVLTEEESQNSVGTRNFKDTTRADSWSNWVDSGSHYDCDVWTPLRSSIDIGQSFEQTRDCSQAQTRERDIYDVWADGSETLKEIEIGNQVVTEEESQNVTGTRNDVDSLRNGTWSNWSDKGQTFNCNSWTPLASTIDYGVSFEQTRNCSQNQERTRNIYNVWTDGSETLKEIEIGNQVIPAEEKQNSVGTRNFKDTTRADNWSAWTNTGAHYNCDSWTPLTSTVDYGDSFEQTRNCSQDQERIRNVYDVWADGSETLKETETGTQVLTEEESQNSVGTRNFKDTTRADDWSVWANTGNHYDCDSWTPAVSTIDIGQSFEQTRNCSQDQERTRNIYDVWADGSETFKEIETGNQVISEEESQDSVGTRNEIDSLREEIWSEWFDSGVPYNCDSWTPLASTVNYGDTFEQTRNCSQNQERTREIFNVWTDGSETLKETERESQTVPKTERQNATGTLNVIVSLRVGGWSVWEPINEPYNCEEWSPATSEIDEGVDFEQTRTCHQEAERTRESYDVWADGSETLNAEYSGSSTTIFESYVFKQMNVGEKYVNVIETEYQKIMHSDSSRSSDHFGTSVVVDERVIVSGAIEAGSVTEGAVYIFKENSNGTWVQSQKLSASDRQKDDDFGYSVDLDVDSGLIVVGAPDEDQGGSNAGAAYIFTDSGSSYGSVKKIRPTSQSSNTWFGSAVEIADNSVFVSARRADGSGAVYEFELSGNNWVQTEKIVPTTRVSNAEFGNKIEVDGNNMLVASQSDGYKGAVYLFQKESDSWVQKQRIVPSTQNAYDYFGSDIALEGNQIIIGARGEDESGNNAGAVYVYELSGSNVTLKEKLLTSNTDTTYRDGYFGYSLSLDNNKLIIGAYGEDLNKGKVHIYHKEGENWVENTSVSASNKGSGDGYGKSVAVSGSLFVVGSPNEDTGGSDAGMVYVIK